MPRARRLELPGAALHVTQSGIAGGAVFLDGEDVATYRTCLDLSLREQGIALHAYVLIPDQVHLLLTSPARGRLACAMERLGRLHGSAFNARHGRIGSPWDSRWTSCLVGSDQDVLALQRHFEGDPVRRLPAAEAADDRWSSVRASLGLDIDPLITPHPAYRALGRDRAERGAAWRRWLGKTVRGDALGPPGNGAGRDCVTASPTMPAAVARTPARPAELRGRGRPRTASAAPATID